MTLYEIIFLIMFAIFIIVMGVVAVAKMLTYAKSKEITKTIEVYQKNFEEINKVLENHKTAYEQLRAQVESLETRIEKLEPKPYTIISSTPVNNSVYVKKADTYTKEKIEEMVDYKAQNEMLKKEIEEYKRLSRNKDEAFKKAYSELLQEKIDRRDWEYLGGKKK